MNKVESSQELAEISDKEIQLLDALESYKSRRDNILIKRTRRELRHLSRKRAALLKKIRKEKSHANLQAKAR